MTATPIGKGGEKKKPSRNKQSKKKIKNEIERTMGKASTYQWGWYDTG